MKHHLPLQTTPKENIGGGALYLICNDDNDDVDDDDEMKKERERDREILMQI